VELKQLGRNLAIKWDLIKAEPFSHPFSDEANTGSVRGFGLLVRHLFKPFLEVNSLLYVCHVWQTIKCGNFDSIFFLFLE